MHPKRVIVVLRVLALGNPRVVRHVLVQPPLEVVKQSVHARALEFPPIEFVRRLLVEDDRRASPSPTASVGRGRGVDRPLVPLEPRLRVEVGVVDEEAPPDLGEFVPHPSQLHRPLLQRAA